MCDHLAEPPQSRQISAIIIRVTDGRSSERRRLRSANEKDHRRHHFNRMFDFLPGGIQSTWYTAVGTVPNCTKCVMVLIHPRDLGAIHTISRCNISGWLVVRNCCVHFKTVERVFARFIYAYMQCIYTHTNTHGDLQHYYLLVKSRAQRSLLHPPTHTQTHCKCIETRVHCTQMHTFARHTRQGNWTARLCNNHVIICRAVVVTEHCAHCHVHVRRFGELNMRWDYTKYIQRACVFVAAIIQTAVCGPIGLLLLLCESECTMRTSHMQCFTRTTLFWHKTFLT